MAKFTQKAIMMTFLDILERKSLDKITVKDIIEQAEINRNTFYYYYEDIYDLIDSIFNDEVEKVRSQMRDDCTFYEAYVNAASILLDHKQAVIHIYNSKSRDIIYIYMQKVTEEFVELFVRKAAEDYDLSEDGIKFISYCYSSATIATTIHWVNEGMPQYREQMLRLMSSSFEATVDDMIRNYLKEEKRGEI